MSRRAHARASHPTTNRIVHETAHSSSRSSLLTRTLDTTPGRDMSTRADPAADRRTRMSTAQEPSDERAPTGESCRIDPRRISILPEALTTSAEAVSIGDCLAPADRQRTAARTSLSWSGGLRVLMPQIRWVVIGIAALLQLTVVAAVIGLLASNDRPARPPPLTPAAPPSRPPAPRTPDRHPLRRDSRAAYRVRMAVDRGALSPLGVGCRS